MMSHQATHAVSGTGHIYRLGALALAVAALTSTAAWAADKNLLLDTGPGGTKTIPLENGTTVQINAQGNLTATCELDGQNNCPDIGTPVGNAPTITFPNVELTQGSTAKTLTWSSNGVACYGVTPTTGVTGWHNGLPSSMGSTTTQIGGLSLSNLTSGNQTPQDYSFRINCYAEGGAMGFKTATVTVNPTQTPQPTQGCQAYLDGLGTSGKAVFNQYYAGNRGMTRHTTTSFSAFTGVTLGKSGSDGSGTATLPGNLAANQYLALEFTMADTSGTGAGTGKFTLNMGEFPSAGQNHDLVVTVSPCEGDFRPPEVMATTDRYRRNVCRLQSYRAGGLIQGRNAGGSYCDTPAGELRYVNVSIRNLYTSGSAFPVTPEIPDDNCTQSNCGANTNITNL